MNFALIMCRKGSRRLPGKNKRSLGHKPLFQWTVDAALDAGGFDHIILSTDDEDILDMGSQIKGLTLDERPKALATDTANSKDVLSYIIDMQKSLGHSPDNFCLLHPTSPFRNKDHIKKAMAMLGKVNVDFVVGISEFSTPPHFALSCDRGLNPIFEGSLTQVTRTQDVPKLFHPSGGIYAGRVQPFLEQKHFYGPRSKGLLLDPLSGWDINTDADFILAQKLFETIN